MAADGEPWKVDVSLWRLGDAPRELYFDPDTLCHRLTAETRGAILWIKDIWHRRPCYPDVVGGEDIYDAVLNHGVRAPAEFAAYLRARETLAESTKAAKTGLLAAAAQPIGHGVLRRDRLTPFARTWLGRCDVTAFRRRSQARARGNDCRVPTVPPDAA